VQNTAGGADLRVEAFAGFDQRAVAECDEKHREGREFAAAWWAAPDLARVGPG